MASSCCAYIEIQAAHAAHGSGQYVPEAAHWNSAMAYLRLVDAKGLACQDRTHFFALSAQIMRRILVDAARRISQEAVH
jgi:hypothetical protein